MSRLLLVDGHALAYRAFYAIRDLRGPDGKPTNAIYGFVGMLRRMREALQPQALAVVWDGGLDAVRLEAVPDYKAQRPAMPDELAAQIEALHEFESAAGLTSLQQDGVEADDWIASLTRRQLTAGGEVVIASPDKDFFQLVGNRVRILNPNDKSGALWGPAEVRAKTGVGPEQIVDWLSLVGDAVDNIAGVSGVGAKTAAKLLGQFGTVDQMYARLAEAGSERLRAALADAEPVVRRNQSVVRLRDDLPLPPGLGNLAPTAPDVARLGALYRAWGFRSWLAELPAAGARQDDLFGVATG